MLGRETKGQGAILQRRNSRLCYIRNSRTIQHEEIENSAILGTVEQYNTDEIENSAILGTVEQYVQH